MFGWFTNLKVVHKLTFGFGLVLLLLLGTLVADVYASAQQIAVTDHIVHHLNPAFVAAHEIVTLTRAADDDGAWYLLARNKQVAAASLRRFEQDVQQLRAAVAKAEALADTTVQRQKSRGSAPSIFAREATTTTRSGPSSRSKKANCKRLTIIMSIVHLFPAWTPPKDTSMRSNSI